jgi:hypothetical protein
MAKTSYFYIIGENKLLLYHWGKQVTFISLGKTSYFISWQKQVTFISLGKTSYFYIMAKTSYFYIIGENKLLLYHWGK